MTAAVGLSSGADQVLLGQQMEALCVCVCVFRTVLLQGVHEVVQVVLGVVLLLVP